MAGTFLVLILLVVVLCIGVLLGWILLTPLAEASARRALAHAHRREVAALQMEIRNLSVERMYQQDIFAVLPVLDGDVEGE